MIYDFYGCVCCYVNFGVLFGFDLVSLEIVDIVVLFVVCCGKVGQLQFCQYLRWIGSGVVYQISELFDEIVDIIIWVYFGGIVMMVDVVFFKYEVIVVKGECIVVVGNMVDVKQVVGEDVEMIDFYGCMLMLGLIDLYMYILIGVLMDQVMEYVGMVCFLIMVEVLDYI